MPQIAALGATLIAVSPQLVEHNREVVERHRLAFDVLSDAGNGVASQFGLTFTLPAELTPEWIRDTLLPVLVNIDQVADMSEAAHSLGRGDADRWLAEAVITVLNEN